MFCPSSSIASQNLPIARQFANCQRLEKGKNEDPRTNDENADDSLEITVNEVFFLEDISYISALKINTKSKSKHENENWKDEKPSSSMTVGQKLF